MEVHTHTHSHGKKTWKSYFWEFLMLFLAVFCGFLAENQREHMIEHQREIKFMRSLVSDVIEDTTEINKTIAETKKALVYQDSMQLYLHYNPPKDYLPYTFSSILAWNALPRITVAFNEVTAMQLKNAGNLRLIRKEMVTRKISIYWKEQENTRINLDRYIIYRNRGREMEEQLFAYSDAFMIQDGLIPKDEKGIRVIQSNPVLWDEYTNMVTHCKVTCKQLVEKLQKQSLLARELIQLLKEEYHL
jgi:hypothetical protein